MQVTVHDEAVVRVAIETDADAAFAKVCEDNPDLRIEQTSEGEIILMSPAGFKSSNRNTWILIQLGSWAERDGKGVVADSNTIFSLPDGSKLGPDAAWISAQKLSQFSESEIAGFLPVAPEFVIELRSKTDRLKTLQKKMKQWIGNGVEIAWLIDADQRKVWIYTQGVEPREEVEPEVVYGEGPVAGFRLEMKRIYEGPTV